MVGDPRISKAAQQALGLPEGFKIYSPFPFGGMNQQSSGIALADQEFLYIENFVRLGDGYLRTVWDVGAPIYSAPAGRTIISYYFFTIGINYYVAVFLSDGSAAQVSYPTGLVAPIGPANTFYRAATGYVPACSQWGTLYLLISNRNTVNDYWAWDGSILYGAGSAAPNGVSNPLILSGGADYNTLPSVTAFGGHGSGMKLVPFVQSGAVVNLQIANPGQGYQPGDIVQVAFSGGGSDVSAVLAATLTAGGVAAASISVPGSGYTHAAITFSGGGGSGAAATATISTSVNSVTVTAPGAGYTLADVTFTGGGGSGAAGTVQLVGGGVVSVTLTNPGTGYTSAPAVAITGDGTGATATCTVNNGTISGITITNSGSGYVTAPVLTITGDGTGASASAILTPSGIGGIQVLTPGSGFTRPPLLTIVGGGGAGATAVALLNPTSIASVNVTAGGEFYQKPPNVVFNPSNGAAAHAILDGDQVVQVIVDNGGSGFTGNVQVQFSPQKGDPGTGAGALAVFAPSSIGGARVTNVGSGYTTAPAVEISPGANNAAYATVELMPFGVSGSSLETYQQRVWPAYPAQQPYGTQSPGGIFQLTAPESLTDFATSDGGVQFTSSDSFLQTGYKRLKQSNGYLYAFGDGSVSVISNVQTSGSPSTTTFNYQNVDPQTGLSWRDSAVDFGRSIIVANETGIYGLYGGSVTKISQKLDKLFATALFPPTLGALAPTGAVATIFNVKHYVCLMTILDPDTQSPRNVMVTWNEKDWVVTSQTIPLTYIGSQKIESKFTAWGTNGTSLYPLFQTPSSTLVKRLDTKLYGNDRPFLIKTLIVTSLVAQDQSAGAAGINCSIEFDVSGLATQDPNDASVPSGIYSPLYIQPSFQAPPPTWPVWRAGNDGLPFMTIGLRLSTSSPDFALGNLMLGYREETSFL